MKSSESIVKITVALLKAQKSMGGAVKDSKNPYFKSNYADYGSVLEASKNPLNDNGILVLQPHTNRDGKNFVETLLVHESGEWLSSETEVVCAKQNDPQALGSAITYARRYGLQSFLSMPTADDDGEAAMFRGKSEAKTTPKTETKTVPIAANGGSVVVSAPKVESAPAAQAATETKKPSFKDKVKKTAPATNGAADAGGLG